MKSLNLAAVGMLAAMLWSCQANAQNVKIYGIVDASATYLNNVGGSSVVRQDSGMMRSTRIGFAGREDLGGGNAAVFKLENGFAIDTGATLINGSLAFQREAWVGVAMPLGTVTVGRQYDFMFTSMGQFANAYFMGAIQFHPQAPNSLLGTNGVSQVLDGTAGTSVDNAVKYESVSVGGFTAGAMLGAGEVAGNTRAGRRFSTHLRYAFGPAIVGVAMTERRSADGSSALRNVGVGAQYQMGAATFNALFTDTRNTADDSRVTIIDLGTRYMVGTALQLGLAYTHIDPNHNKKNMFLTGMRNQLGLGLDYFLSKRTDVYTSLSYQKATGGNLARMFGAAASSKDAQAEFNVGMRLTF